MTSSAQPQFRVAVACGGTGGHFYPGLTVAHAAIARGFAVSLILTGRLAAEQALLGTDQGFAVRVLPGLSPPVGLVGKAAFALRLGWSVWQHRRELRAIRADALLAMGSFNAVPTVLAAAWLGIPVFLHEGNARIGKANLFLSRWARHLAMAFPPVNAAGCRCPWSVTGMPVRAELCAKPPTREDAIARLRRETDAPLQPGLPTVLVFGGSQGARTLNQALPEAVINLARVVSSTACQVIHLAGGVSAAKVAASYADGHVPALVLPGREDMASLYAVADLVVCRAGGSTLAELAIFGKGAVLVPFPYAADRHQDDNAACFVRGEAAVTLADAECTAERMTQLLAEWLRLPELWRERGRRAAALAQREATSAVLDLMVASVGRHEPLAKSEIS